MYGTTHGLMDALYLEKQAKVAVEGRLMNLREDYLEQLTAKEVELDEAKVEIIRLKTKLRQLSADKNIQDICSSFEEDLKRLNSENDVLRRRNLMLEEKCLNAESESLGHALRHDSNLSAAKAKISQSVDISSSERWLADEFKAQNSSTLKIKLRDLSRDNIVLKAENEELRKKERQYLIAERTASEHSNRIKNLNEEYQRSRRALEIEKELTVRLQNEVLTLRGHRSQQEETESLLQSERARLQKQVALLQKQVIDVCEDKKNVDKLARFIEKHSPHSPSSVKAPNPKHRDLNDFSEPPRHSRRLASSSSLTNTRGISRSASAHVNRRLVQDVHVSAGGGRGRLSSYKNLVSSDEVGDLMPVGNFSRNGKWQ